jgi:hypothetical protein
MCPLFQDHALVKLGVSRLVASVSCLKTTHWQKTFFPLGHGVTIAFLCSRGEWYYILIKDDFPSAIYIEP